MKIKVFIDGAEGTTGLRIRDRIEKRNELELISLPEEKRKDLSFRQEALNTADVAFLCLPDDAAAQAAALCHNPKTTVIDASTAHRTCDAWAYGLPELSCAQRDKIRTSRRIAVPGCHATGFVVLAAPLISKGAAAADYPFCATSVTGYSGGGKKMIADYADIKGKQGYDGPRQYALSQQHKHLPEMQKAAGLADKPLFSPVVGNFYAGMVVSLPVYSRLLRGRPSAADIHRLYSEYYRGESIVRVMPFGGEGVLKNGFLDASGIGGYDHLEIFVGGNDDRILIASRFDNLGKGASGAAVQCMNIVLGLPETAGLCIPADKG